MPTVAQLLPDVDVEAASYHLAQLHRGAVEDEFASLVLLGGRRREAHGFLAVSELYTSRHNVETVHAALEDVVRDRWNVYTACSTFRHVPNKGRGRREDVSTVPGVWADLDVKTGFFDGEDAIADFVARLPTPTLRIMTGSGGQHCYWLTHERMSASQGQALLDQWLDFLRAESTVPIDNVHDTPRILRVAGTVRWPKVEDEIDEPRYVTIVPQVGPRYHVGELQLISDEAHSQAIELRHALSAERRARQEETLAVIERAGMSSRTFELIVRDFNARQDWEPLLLWDGWTLNSDERDRAGRCRYWTRPGKDRADGKSASTDWVDDRGIASTVMTIYSNAPDLLPLWENDGTSAAHGICSKYHFVKTRFYGGDDAATVAVIENGGGVLG